MKDVVTVATRFEKIEGETTAVFRRSWRTTLDSPRDVSKAKHRHCATNEGYLQDVLRRMAGTKTPRPADKSAGMEVC